MTSATRTTVVGVFEDRAAAERAVDRLKDAGFNAQQVGFAGHGEHDKPEGLSDDKAENIATGAAAGLIPGGIIGGVLGAVATGLIPGIGPVISAGILAGTLGGAAAGAAAGGVLGALTGLGIPEDEARYYEGEFKSGRTLVTVKAGGRYDEASRMLRDAGAYDIESQGATNRETASIGTPSRDTDRMEMREEVLKPRTETVQTGEARIGKEVVEEQRTIDVPRTREEVVVERTPVEGRPSASGSVGSNEEIRVPINEEQVRVDKDTVVREEVGLHKEQVQETEQVTETVRREEPRIERPNT